MRSILGPLSTIWFDNVGLDRFIFLCHGLLWQLRRRLGMSFVTSLANGAKVKIYPATAFSAVFYCRWIERNDLLFLRANAHLAPTFVDVGAHCGLISAQLFDKFTRFYLFEPAVSSFSVLQENCNLNSAIDCRTFNIAISDREGEVAFLDEGNYSGTSRLVDESKVIGGAICRVPVNTLDNMLREVDGGVVLKVDVEGAEERVFRGARALFGSQRIKLVLFERLGRTNLDNIMKFMSDHDYIVFRVNGDGTMTQDQVAIREPLINLFACPRALSHQIAAASISAESRTLW